MNKHAFLILAYDRWEQLSILLKTLDNERNDIFLHINANIKDVPFDKLKNSVVKSNVYFVDRIPVRWGTYDIFDATLNCIKSASKMPCIYEYYHLLSGQDLPIKKMDYIHNFFEVNKGKNFINSYPVDMLPIDWRERVSLHNIFVGNFRGKNMFVRLYSKLFNKILKCFERILSVDRVKKYEKQGIVISGGSTWFSITEEFAKYLISQEKLIQSIFKDYSWFADEMILQTMAWSSDFRDTIFNTADFVEDGTGSLRYIDWNRGKPYTWRIEDFDTLINSNYLFARKFDEKIDIQVINKIYNYLRKDVSN